jgi:hypothetical protein
MDKDTPVNHETDIVKVIPSHKSHRSLYCARVVVSLVLDCILLEPLPLAFAGRKALPSTRNFQGTKVSSLAKVRSICFGI